MRKDSFGEQVWEAPSSGKQDFIKSTQQNKEFRTVDGSNLQRKPENLYVLFYFLFFFSIDCVAGTIAAVDDLDGVIGVAPGVDLYIVRVFDAEGWAYSSTLIDALDRCVAAGSKV